MTQQQFERNRRFFQSIRLDNRRTMLTGKVQEDGSVTLAGAPTNKTWVRDTGDSRRSVPAWGNIPTANVPVIVDINPEGELEIVGVNWTVGNPMFGGALQGVAAPAIQGDVQALNVSAQNITIGRLQPSGAGGLNVQAVGFHTPDGFWRGGTVSATAQGGLDQTGNDLDLASNVPGTADQVRWVRVYYDPSSGALAAANGTAAVQTVSDLDEADIEAIAIPAGTYPVGAVALSYGQTDFDTASQVRFAPARYFLSPEGHLLTGDAVTRTLASGVLTVGAESLVRVAAESSTSDDWQQIVVTGASRLLGFLADAGDTITAKEYASGSDNLYTYAGTDLDFAGEQLIFGWWDADDAVLRILGGGGGAFTDLSDTFAYSGNGDKAVFVNAGESALEARDAMPVASKNRWVGTVLWDKTNGSAGSFDSNSTDDLGNSGAFGTDYDLIEGIWLLRGAATATAVAARIALNNDTTATNYQRPYDYKGSADGQGLTNNSRDVQDIAGDNATANYFSSGRFFISNPGSAAYKAVVSKGDDPRSSSAHLINDYDVLWRNTAAITRIALDVNNATTTFVTGSRLILIGWKLETIGGIAYSTADVSNPPTDAELDSAFGAPATLPVPFAAIVNDNNADTAMWLVASNGTSWWYSAMTKAV